MIQIPIYLWMGAPSVVDLMDSPEDHFSSRRTQNQGGKEKVNILNSTKTKYYYFSGLFAILK